MIDDEDIEMIDNLLLDVPQKDAKRIRNHLSYRHLQGDLHSAVNFVSACVRRVFGGTR